MFGLATYSDSLRGKETRNISVQIEQVENGYIFELRGETENILVGKNVEFDSRWISIHKSFVYTRLEDGLKETQGFFDTLKKELVKKKSIINKRYKQKEKGDL